MALRFPFSYVRIAVGENQSNTQNLTRRELLKRGAILGGALAWATPAVQLIGMTPAMATHVSEACLCVKNDPPGSTTFIPLSGSSGECLDPIDGCSDPISIFSGEIAVTAIDGGWRLQYPANCNVIALSIKCGSGAPGSLGCAADACTCWFEGDSTSPEDLSYTIDGFPDSKFIDLLNDDCNVGSISHIEFCIQCP